MSAQFFHFKVSKGGHVLRETTLAQNVIKIGRMASSHLQIDDELISRMHAVIEAEGPGQASIIDLGSEAGTMVNGKKVNKAPLYSGDVITLGGIEIYVTISAEGEAVQPFPATELAQDFAQPVEDFPSYEVAAEAPYEAEAAVQYEADAAVQYEADAAVQYVAPPSNPIPLAQVQIPPPVYMPPHIAQRQAPPVARTAPVPRVAAGGHYPIQPATPYDVNAMEDASSYGTEVVIVWKDVVLQTAFYKPTLKNPKNFCIGEDATCDFPIQGEYLQGQVKVPLVVNHVGGGATVNIPPSAQGDVTYEDGQRVALADLINAGHAQPSPMASGCYAFSLPSRVRVKVDVGDFSFFVSSVPSPRKLALPFNFDWHNQIYNGIAFLAHFLVLGLAFFDPGNLSGLSLDYLDDASRLVNYNLVPFEMEEMKDDVLSNKDDEKEGGKGKRHVGEEGQMGKRDAAKTNNRYGIKGPADNPNPHMARDMAKEMAKDAGILSYLSAANAPTSPFGQDTALGIDPENALGALMGDQVGENFGYGGLGLRGTGRGGGGTGEGTIGLGNLNTIGHGGGGGSGSGYGRGAGGLGGRRGTAPGIRSGATMVQGSLSKEVIRRIVHRHINEVKFCYERQLAQRPDLAGRVSVKFIISGTGAVQMAALADSSVGDPAVENCIVQAVRRWTFPQPEGGGIVVVTYPFLLTAPEG